MSGITVKNSDIWGAKGAFEKLIVEKLPVAVSYKMALMAVEVGKQHSVLAQVSDGLVRKYGTEKEGSGLTVEKDSENWNEFVTEFNEVMGKDFELALEKLVLPSEVSYTCEKCQAVVTKPLELEPMTLIALLPFIEVTA